MLNRIIEKSLNKEQLLNNEIDYLLKLDTKTLTEAADRIKSHFFDKSVEFCSIINAKSGRCPEDCKFCAQSSHYNTSIKIYDFLDIETIKKAIEYAKSKNVKRFSIVTSGKKLDKANFNKLIEAIKTIKQLGLKADVSVGILSYDEIMALKDAGLDGFHHNLETSRSYFKNVCTTHEYDEDVESIKSAKKAGLFVCSGGIFGIGESWQDRIEMALLLKDLNVDSVPLNFLTPIKGTPYENRPILSKDEALRIIAIFRFILSDKHIRVCGGRSTVFGLDDKFQVLKSGANGIMVGNYLTTTGFSVDSDLDDIKRLSLKLA